MTTPRFNLIFEGTLEPGHDPADVRRTLEDLFEFDTTQQNSLFSGLSIILGEAMDVTTAKSFRQALAGAGATTRLETVNEAAVDRTISEQRSTQRRAHAPRRSHSRPTAIQPDRREQQTRRRDVSTTS